MDTITVAICDDEKAIQQSLRRSIEHFFADSGLFCQVNCYDSGEEALGKDKSFSPDLFFLDIQMTGKNGMEIAREFRMHNKNTIKTAPNSEKCLTGIAKKENHTGSLEKPDT